MLSKLTVIYIILINILAFSLFGIDKSRAINHKWRISEKALFLVIIAGGSIGSLLGMHFFHHKTKHWYFRYGIPVVLVLHVVLFGVIALK